MKTIYIKAFFEWRKVTPEKAYDFCKRFMDGIQTTAIREEKIAIINEGHLKGITFEELEKEVNHE